MAVKGVSGIQGNPTPKPNRSITVGNDLNRAVSPDGTASTDGYTSRESPLSLEIDFDGIFEDEDKKYGQEGLPTDSFPIAIRDRSATKHFFSSIPLEDGSTLVLLNHLSKNGEQIDLFGKGAEGKVRPGLIIDKDGSEQYVAIKKESLESTANTLEQAEEKVNLVQSIRSSHVLPIFKGVVSESKKRGLTLYTASPIMKSSLSKQEDIEALIIPKHIESIRELLTGLKDIHLQDILHRDLSVDNIFIDHTGKIMIGDFGVAKQLDGPDGKLHYHGKEKIQIQFGNCELEDQPAVTDGSITNFSKKSEVFTIGFSIYESIFLFQNGVDEGNKPFTNLKEYHEEAKLINQTNPENYDSYIKSLSQTSSLSREEFDALKSRLESLKSKSSENLTELLDFMDNFFLHHDERPDAETLLQQYNKLFPIDEESLKQSQATLGPEFEPAKKSWGSAHDSGLTPQQMLENTKLIAAFSNTTSEFLSGQYTSLDPPEKEIYKENFITYVSLMIDSNNIDLMEQLNTEGLDNELKAPLEKILISTQSTYSDERSVNTSRDSLSNDGYDSDGELSDAEW